LKQFLPIRETVETLTLADQGSRPYKISLGERAYTLPDHCETYSRSPLMMTEETRKPPQPTKTLLKPQHTPSFLYSCEQYTNKPGLIASLGTENKRLK
jgi:hypothetical protein